DRTLAPGESATVPKTVHTPLIPPRPDVVLLVDSTGSMYDAIKNVKDNLPVIINKVHDVQPDPRFAVVMYGDQREPKRLFRVLQPLTGDLDAVRRGVAALNAIPYSGGDVSEDWINALYQVGHGEAGEFRPGASPIVVLVGDASSHEPSATHSLDDAIGALRDAHARVL